MELKRPAKKLKDLLVKYKFVFLMIIIGVVLMLLPNGSSDAQGPTPEAQRESTVISLDTQLTEILSNISGAGNVKVMLTVGKGEETIFQTDTDELIESDRKSVKTSVIVISDSQRNENGLVKQINPPTYCGAIIVCQGGDDPVVRLAIADAVSKVTGLGLDRISILKMK